MRVNAGLLSQWLQEKYGENEITEEQFSVEVDDFLGFGDLQTHRKYLEYAVTHGLIQQTSSGKYVAVPKNFLSPRQKLKLLREKNKLKQQQQEIEEAAKQFEDQIKEKQEQEKMELKK
jgi:hypothetical protein